MLSLKTIAFNNVSTKDIKEANCFNYGTKLQSERIKSFEKIYKKKKSFTRNFKSMIVIFYCRVMREMGIDMAALVSSLKVDSCEKLEDEYERAIKACNRIQQPFDYRDVNDYKIKKINLEYRRLGKIVVKCRRIERI